MNKERITDYLIALKVSFKFFVVTTIIALIISTFADSHFLHFIWFYGNIAFFIFMMVLCFKLKPKRDFEEDEEDLIEDERNEGLYSSTYNYETVEHSTYREPLYSEEILQGEANALKDTFISKYNEMKFSPKLPTNTPPKEIYLTNEKAVVFLEKELKALQKFSITDLQARSEKLYNYYCYKAYNQMHFEPILNFLKSIKVDAGTLSTFQGNLNKIESLHKQALEETEKQLRIIASGVIGEKDVDEELSMYDYLWERYSGLRMEIDGMSVETDSLIITTRGIFSLEIKNYAKNGNYSLHVTKDGQWGKVYENGKKDIITDSVTSQMNRHIALKQKLVNQELQTLSGTTTPFISFHPIFVIANEKVHIQNDSDLPIMRASQVYHHIMKFPEILTTEQIKDVVDIIEKNKLPVKKYGYKQYTDLFNYIVKTANEKCKFTSDAVNLIDEYASNVSKKVNKIDTHTNY